MDLAVKLDRSSAVANNNLYKQIKTKRKNKLSYLARYDAIES